MTPVRLQAERLLTQERMPSALVATTLERKRRAPAQGNLLETALKYTIPETIIRKRILKPLFRLL